MTKGWFGRQQSLSWLRYRARTRTIEWLVRHTSLLDGRDGPPEWINFVGGGDFRRVGEAVAKRLVQHTGMSPDARVLDVGSGMGRVAAALARRYPALDYEGFDVVGYGIAWSRKALAEHPSFGFTHADVCNGLYNPRGAIESTAFRFPYGDGSFDLVFATSVFTHLLPDAAEHYLAEAARVTRPGGCIYLTAFLHDPPLPEGARFTFAHPMGEAFCQTATDPESAVAYPAAFWQERCDRMGLRWRKTFHGSWRSGEGRSLQDALLLRVPRR